ncbi:MAG: hypothetical protein ACLQIJ_15430 [Polyangia bacterium]
MLAGLGSGRTLAVEPSAADSSAGWVALSISAEVPAGTKLPSLEKDERYCRSVEKDSSFYGDHCWYVYMADLNGDGLNDIVIGDTFMGNDPELAEAYRKIILYLGTGDGFKRVLKTEGILDNDGSIYLFGDSKCRSIGQIAGPRKAPTKMAVWACKDGTYPTKPRVTVTKRKRK